jgi:hypothetical protein
LKIFLLKSLTIISSASIALLLVINTAIASPIINKTEFNSLQMQLQQVSLNINSVFLSSAIDKSNLLTQHLGCSCAICLGQISSIDF